MSDGSPDVETSSRRPWWVYTVPYPGKVPALTQRQWSVMGLLSAAEFFDHYDMGIMGLALSQIQAGLGIAEADVAGVTAVVRFGALPALALMVMADRVGRRGLLLATILGFTLCTFGTAFAQDARQYMALQFMGRIFIYAELMLAPVVVAEELQARDRGWGIGMLGAIGGLGHGAAAVVFAFVDDLPFGWRALYAIGVVPMVFLAWFRRSLTETPRFEAHREARGTETGLAAAMRPAISLVRMYPGRIAVLALALFPFDFAIGSAFTFLPKTLQEVHGYSPGQVTALFLTGGALGILGSVFAGALADRFGRKPVMVVAMIVNGTSMVGFYNASGWAIPLLWVTTVFTILAIGVLFKALGAELFPTSYRSTASGMRMVVGTLGAIAGLALEGTLYELTGSHAAAISWMSLALILPPLVIGFLLPETATRELEDIAPERPLA